MSNTQPIQFLLHQLATNEQDRERFNLVNPFLIQFNYDEYHQLRLYILNKREDIIMNSAGVISDFTINKWFDYFSVIIRTCLSRYQAGENNNRAIIQAIQGWNQPVLYEAFDFKLRNGESLDTALSALHDKMLELVPEYREFLNNNK